MCLNDYLYNAQQLRTTRISRKKSVFVELRPQKHMHLKTNYILLVKETPLFAVVQWCLVPPKEMH